MVPHENDSKDDQKESTCTWAFWAPLNDAGEALMNLANVALNPTTTAAAEDPVEPTSTAAAVPAPSESSRERQSKA